MDGSQVGPEYYASLSSPGMLDMFIKKVKEYCMEDVKATMEVYKKFLESYL
jgi:hypothetical protein